jgi:hypothetical protein
MMPAASKSNIHGHIHGNGEVNECNSGGVEVNVDKIVITTICKYVN